MSTLVDLAPPSSPYKGLAPFDDSELDAFLFFGRASETEVVAANVLASRLTVLYGPSGVGKSSLLRAGVVRTLRAEPGPRPAVVFYGSWAGDPLAGLAEASRAAVAEALGREPAEAPGALADQLAAWSAELGAEICLLLDQLEELFLYHPGEGAGGFVGLLPELVARPGLRVNVLLGIRDDALSQLDVFKSRIPGLFANSLRLDHLDREAGRAAILGPLECYAELAGQEAAVEIEPALVDTVLDEVSAGRIEPGLVGRGSVPRVEGAGGLVETPYLQLVLQRMWDVEQERGSRVLRLGTFRDLGGAQRIVEDHLERALQALSPAEQDAAANVFGHLVTPSGTKIAHGVTDLASYAEVGEGDLEPVLRSLAGQRILRPLGENGHAGGRYEIFHDVLADAVLAWRTRHEAEGALLREREAARRRQRRLAWVMGAALAALALMTALTAYAFSQRSEAREQAARASEQQAEAERQARLVSDSLEEVRVAQAQAEDQAGRAVREAQRARDQTQIARQARRQADIQKQAALEARAEADASAARAAEGEGSAVAAQAVAEQEEAKARRAEKAATVEEGRAKRAKARAVAASKDAVARRLLAQSLAVLATNPEQSARLALKASDRDPSKQAEDALRSALVALRLEHVLPGAGAANPVARFSRDGSRIVVGGVLPRIRVYRSNGTLMRGFNAGAIVNDAALSRNGTLVAAAGEDGRVRIWNVATGALRTIDHDAPVRGLAWSPTADILVTVGSGSAPSARVWNASTGTRLHVLRHPLGLETASFSRDGSRFVTLGKGRVARVFDVETGALLATLEHPTGEITSAAFGPGGKLVVTGGRDRVARVWEVATGEQRFVLTSPSGQVLDVAFSSNGKWIATAGTDSVARIWDARDGSLEDVLHDHGGPPVNDVEFAPGSDWAVVTAGDDGTARYWAPGQQPVPLLGHSRHVVTASFSPNGRWILTAGRDHTARLWDPYAEPQLHQVTRHERAVRAVAVNGLGTKIASGGADGVLRVTTTGGEVLETLSLGRPIVSVAWARRERLIAAMGNGEVRIWARGGKQLLATVNHDDPIRAATISPDGAFVATAGQDGHVRVWRVAGAAHLRTLDHPDSVAALAFDPAGRVLATASGPVAFLWRVSDGRQLGRLEGHGDDITAVAFGGRGRLLATSSDDRDARTWYVRTRKLARRFVGHGGPVAGVALSSDSRWLATAGPRKVGIWQIAKSDLPRNFLFFVAGNAGTLSSVAFSPRNWTVVTGSLDGSVRSYGCLVCGGLRELRALAKPRLNRLAAESKR
jgi:WD40 repeat protein